MVRALLLIVAIPALLTACFPYATSYVHLDAPGVTYIQAACKGVGPPVFASFERNGARFDVTLEPGWAARTKNGFLRVIAPSGAQVSLPDPKASLIAGGGEVARFELRLSIKTSTEHRFEFPDGLVIPSSGALRLPTVVIDGVRIEPPEFAFARRPYAGIAPLNC